MCVCVLCTNLYISNFGHISNNGRKLVIGVRDPGNTKQSTDVRNAMLKLARPNDTPLDSAVLETYSFGLLDGVKWTGFTKQYHVHDSANYPSILVLDTKKSAFWRDFELDGSTSGWEGYLNGIADGSIEPLYGGVWAIPRAAKQWWDDSMPWSPGTYKHVKSEKQRSNGVEVISNLLYIHHIFIHSDCWWCSVLSVLHYYICKGYSNVRRT